MKGTRRQPGFIVLVVTVVIVMITLAGLAFVLNLSTENKAVHLQGDQRQLQQSLASGVEMMRGFLAQPPAERQLAGGCADNSAVFAAVQLDSDPMAGETRFSVVSPRLEGDADSGLRFGLQNESARLNLAALSAWDAAEPGAASAALMNLPGMTEPIADAILDWIDGDATPRTSGAEAEYYKSRGLPYEPRNGVPAVLDELLLVRDVSRTSLFGADANFNYRVETAELQQAGSGAEARSGEQTPWAWLLTIYSGERNRTSDGTPRIYLNESDLAALHKQLAEAFDQEAADFVIGYRQFGPVDATAESQTATGRASGATPRSGRKSATRRARPARGDSGESELDLSLPAEYEIESILDLIDARVIVPSPPVPEETPARPSRLSRRKSTTRRGPGGADSSDLPDAPTEGPDRPTDAPEPPTEVANPFQRQMDRLRDYLPQWMELTSTTQDEVFRGRVNINEAPRAVLLGVPGLDPPLVDQIVSTRSVSAVDASLERRYPAWLFTEGLVGVEQMRRLEPYLTCGGDVYRAQIVAFGGRSGMSARAEVVLDATVSPPRQVYWKDLGLLGRGFTNDELGAESALGEVGILD